MVDIVQDLWGNAVFHEEARTADPETSHQAAKLPFRRASQRHDLLIRYEQARWHDTIDRGLTDEQAATAAGITKGCPWKRCSELREAGLIAPIGITRPSSGGANQRVCAITPQGVEILHRLEER